MLAGSMGVYCDNRNDASSPLIANLEITPKARCGDNRNMAVDRHWILDRLTGKRGEKADLARALGIPSHHLSKILSGERRLTPHEADAARQFFGEAQTLTEEEADMIALFRLIPESKRAATRSLFQALADQEASAVAPGAEKETSGG